MFIEQIIYRLD